MKRVKAARTALFSLLLKFQQRAVLLLAGNLLYMHLSRVSLQLVFLI